MKIINTLTQQELRILMIVTLLVIPVFISAQGDKKLIRQGNREYEKDRYSEAEISYRKAIDRNNLSSDAVFNVGDALYKQKKFEDAGKQFVENHSLVEDRIKKSASLYNLGNSLLMADKIQESIDAYKASLRSNPSNIEAKYNLAYAQDLLKQQQKQQQQQQQSDQDNKNKDQNQSQQNRDREQDKNQQKQEQEQQKISREDAQRLLNALANDEKDVQEKVKLAKAMKERVRTFKNW